MMSTTGPVLAQLHHLQSHCFWHTFWHFFWFALSFSLSCIPLSLALLLACPCIAPGSPPQVDTPQIDTPQTPHFQNHVLQTDMCDRPTLLQCQMLGDVSLSESISRGSRSLHSSTPTTSGLTDRMSSFTCVYICVCVCCMGAHVCVCVCCVGAHVCVCVSAETMECWCAWHLYLCVHDYVPMYTCVCAHARACVYLIDHSLTKEGCRGCVCEALIKTMKPHA